VLAAASKTSETTATKMMNMNINMSVAKNHIRNISNRNSNCNSSVNTSPNKIENAVKTKGLVIENTVPLLQCSSGKKLALYVENDHERIPYKCHTRFGENIVVVVVRYRYF